MPVASIQIIERFESVFLSELTDFCPNASVYSNQYVPDNQPRIDINLPSAAQRCHTTAPLWGHSEGAGHELKLLEALERPLRVIQYFKKPAEGSGRGARNMVSDTPGASSLTAELTDWPAVIECRECSRVPSLYVPENDVMRRSHVLSSQASGYCADAEMYPSRPGVIACLYKGRQLEQFSTTLTPHSHSLQKHASHLLPRSSPGFAGPQWICRRLHPGL